jgi:hypothetical protein
MRYCSLAISALDTSVQQGKYRDLGYVVDQSVDGVKSRFSRFPLFRYN